MEKFKASKSINFIDISATSSNSNNSQSQPLISSKRLRQQQKGDDDMNFASNKHPKPANKMERYFRKTIMRQTSKFGPLLLALCLLTAVTCSPILTSAWHLYEPMAETSRVVQALAAGLSGPANQPPSTNGYQQLLSSPIPTYSVEQPTNKPTSPVLTSSLVEAASQVAQNVVDAAVSAAAATAAASDERKSQQVSNQVVTASANSSKPSLLGKILEAQAEDLKAKVSVTTIQQQQNPSNNSVAEKIGQAAYQLLKPRRSGTGETISQQLVAAAEERIRSQHTRQHHNHHLSSAGSTRHSHQQHQHLVPTKHRDQKLSSLLLDSASGTSTGRDSPLSSLFSGFKSGVTSRSSIVKAISDNGIARTLSSVSKSLGGNKYVAGAAAASALAALGLTVSKLFTPYFMSSAGGFSKFQDPMLGSGSSLFGSALPPPSLTYDQYLAATSSQPTATGALGGFLGTRAQSQYQPAQTFEFASPSSVSSSFLGESTGSNGQVLNYDANALYSAPSSPLQSTSSSQPQDLYVNYKPAPVVVSDSSPGSTSGSIGGHYSSFYPETSSSFASDSHQQQPPASSVPSTTPTERYFTSSSAAYGPASDSVNQLYSASSGNQQVDQFLPSASMETPVFSVRPPPSMNAPRAGSSGGRRSGTVPLKIDDATRKAIEQQLEIQRQQRAHLINVLSLQALQQAAQSQGSASGVNGQMQAPSFAAAQDKFQLLQPTLPVRSTGYSDGQSIVVDGFHHAPLSNGARQQQQGQQSNGMTVANLGPGYSIIASPAQLTKQTANVDLSPQLINANSVNNNNNNNINIINDKQQQQQEPEARESTPLRSFAAPQVSTLADQQQQQQQRQQRAWQFLVPNRQEQELQQANIASNKVRVSRTPANQSSDKTTNSALTYRQPALGYQSGEASALTKGLTMNSAGGGLIAITGPSFGGSGNSATTGEQVSSATATTKSSGQTQSYGKIAVTTAASSGQGDSGRRYQEATRATNLIQLNETPTDHKNGAIRLIEANGSSGTQAASVAAAATTVAVADGKLATGGDVFNGSQVMSLASGVAKSSNGNRAQHSEQQVGGIAEANEDSQSGMSNDDAADADTDQQQAAADNQQVTASSNNKAQWTAMPTAQRTSARRAEGKSSVSRLQQQQQQQQLDSANDGNNNSNDPTQSQVTNE